MIINTKEYFFDNRFGLPLEGNYREIFDSEVLENSGSYLISNTQDVKSILYAPEVNFYLTYSQDDTKTKLETLNLLYEIRALKYDLGRDKSYSKEVDNSLIIISEQETFNNISPYFEDDFEVIFCDVKNARDLEGELGSFTLNSSNRFIQKEEIKASQIVITQDDPQKEQFIGVEKYSGEETIGNILELLKSRLGHYEYKKIISYNETICQYHHRRQTQSGPCTICSQLCPTLGVKHDNSKMELTFSDIDCHGCGGCVSGCPSGALDFTQFTLEALYGVARLLEGKKIFITTQSLIPNLDISLPKNVIPLVIEGAKFLSELHFLTLLQESGAQIVFYTDVISKGVKDSQKIINQIWQKRFGKDGVFITMDKENLATLLESQDFIEDSCYKNSLLHQKSKRAKFATRLQYLTGERELGRIESGEVISYGVIEVQKDKCTLCLSCVGACNVDALKGDEKTLSLQFNPSLCTNCGYCLASCPENCMELDAGQIELSPLWFRYQELASDELFYCVECGEAFGTKKSVEKIFNILSPLFENDPIKKKTLTCCEKCKPKVILPNILKFQREGISV